MRSSGKGQIQAEVFIYILAVVITGAILLFGYTAIRDFVGKGEEATFIKLKTDLERDIASIRSDFGTVRLKEYQIPAKYSKVCFVGEERIKQGRSSGLSDDNVIIKDSIESKVEKNVFFLPEGTDSIYAGPVSAQNDFICFNVVQGSIRLRLEGKGATTAISPVPTA